MKSLFLAVATVSSLLVPALAATGDTQCAKAMCVTAIVHNNQTTSYTLTVSQQEVGWMSIGFGQTMVFSPLVVLWRDSTGNTIVSQRSANEYVEPTVVTNPTSVATPLNYAAASNSTAHTLAFSVTSTTETRQRVVWAWCKTAPSGSAVDTTLTEHDDNGSFTLNLSNPLPDSVEGTGGSSSAAGTATGAPTATPSSGSSNNDDEDEEALLAAIPLTQSQKVFLAHGVLLTLAFMILLPIGVLQARLLRTFVPGKWWFTAHWILQWPVTGTFIIIGFALAVNEVNRIKSGQLNSTHKKWGLVLILLYIVQCSLGGIIHFVKSSKAVRRPPQNYGHAVLGLIIISLSFWQVYTGFNEEWKAAGGQYVPRSVRNWWTAWVVILSVTYALGLGLLPRQWKKEAEQRNIRRTPATTISNPKLQNRFGP